MVSITYVGVLDVPYVLIDDFLVFLSWNLFKILLFPFVGIESPNLEVKSFTDHSIIFECSFVLAPSIK